MIQEKTKLHVERLDERYRLERLLIASGAVFNLIYLKKKPISAVAIAIELEITVAMVRYALVQLEKDGLVVQNFKGDWEVAI
ncbi:MAG: hypothetical protein QNJ72_27145 [Pleurocapsa sp. MO_226.B13]|nr:hypothetical protein [Pleurocapsa sp. MO_226.B13]